VLTIKFSNRHGFNVWIHHVSSLYWNKLWSCVYILLPYRFRQVVEKREVARLGMLKLYSHMNYDQQNYVTFVLTKWLVLVYCMSECVKCLYICISSIKWKAGGWQEPVYSKFLRRTKTDLELCQCTKRCLHVLVVVLHNCSGRTHFSSYCHLVTGLFTGSYAYF